MTLLPLRARSLGALLALAFATGCYDHRITQAIVERRKAAKQAEGSEIRPNVSATSAKYSGLLKLYVSDAYRSQHPDWKEVLLDLVDAANAVLVPSFALRLETAAAREWSPQCDGTELQPCLEELVQLDPGVDGEWILGILPAQPRFVTNFEDLGRATAPGRHMVVRDVSDLAERDAIDRAFSTMTQARRDEIYRHRKQHKRLAVFLHEWAHTMGAPHTSDKTSLLFPTYDDRMERFDEATARTVTAAVEPRFAQPAAAVASAAADNAAPSPATRPNATASNNKAAHPYAVRGSEDELLAELTPADRAVYRGATEQANADDAYSTLQPLVARYPSNYAVQHLACGLAMQLGRSADAQVVCTRMQGLAPGRQ
ncbi:MAG TPA: hypothetical protein VFZ61_31245 [Polyangiales bacterium]